MSGEDKRLHLQFIQNAVTRMAWNSFMVKGWTVLVVSALFALASEGTADGYVYIALFPAIVFWGLGGYFLAAERRFRKLYDHIRKQDESVIDFSMNWHQAPNTPGTDAAAARDWLNSTVSKTLIPFYGVVLLAIVVAMIGL